MKKLLSLIFFCNIFISFLSAQCSEGFNQTFAILNFGSGNVYYNLQSTSSNPTFEGVNLGNFCPGATFLFEGGQNQVWKCGGADIWENDIWYRIYSTSGSGGSFNQVGQFYQSGSSNGCGGADQTWEANASGINILSGLAAGKYYLEVYSSANYQYCGSGTIYASNSGYNYRASFTVDTVPSVTASSNSPVCTGQSLTLSGNPSGYSYSWSGPSSYSSSTKSPTVSSSATTGMAGTYTLVVTTDSGCTVSNSTSVIIHPSPTAQGGPNQTVEINTSALLGDTLPVGGTAPYTYHWSPSDGLNDTTISRPTATPFYSTDYALVVTDNYGCIGRDTVAVNFIKGNAITEITYTAENINYSSSGGQSYVDFDVFATDTPDGLLFSQGVIFIQYDTLIFGKSIVDSNKIVASMGLSVDSPYYNLTLTDSTPNMLKISVVHRPSPAALSNLSTNVSQQLCHLKIDISAFNLTNVTAAYDSILMAGLSKYQRTLGGVEYPYDIVRVDGLVDAAESTNINFQLANENYTATNGYLTFDVQAQSDEGDPFYDGSVTISYNTNNFGSSAASNGNLNCTLSSSIGSTYFSLLTPSDASSSSFTITVNPTSTYTDGYNYLFGSPPTGISTISAYTTLATCTLTVQKCCYSSGSFLTITAGSGDYAAISDYNLDDSDPDTSNWAYVPSPSSYALGDLLPAGGYNNGNGNICPNTSGTPTISSLDPLSITAGTFSVLTITGSGFGCTPGIILFANANDGGASTMHTQIPDIQSWDDDQIKVWVPSDQDPPFDGIAAGSGQIRVVTSDGTTSDLSTDNLDIPYAAQNARDASNNPVYVGLMNENGTGGYTFTPDSSMSGAALTTITQAMNDWVCQTGVNFTMGASQGGLSSNPADGINSVFFGTTPSGILALTTVAINKNAICYTLGTGVADALDIDMKISSTGGSTAAWYYVDSATPPSSQISLLGTIRHEFGHASGLREVNNGTDLMYYEDLGAGMTALSIQHDDQNGGLFVLTDVGPNHMAGCFPINEQVTVSGCPTLPIENGIISIPDNPFTFSGRT
jgi:hypothetical protein